MIDPLNDRAEAFLSEARRAVVPVPELARRLRAEPDTLARQLDDDPRFVLIRSIAFPDITVLPDIDRGACVRALEAAGVHVEPRVALAEPPDLPPDSPVELLLRNSVVRLLARSSDPALAAAAERLRSALAATVTPAEDPDGTAPSTTPPPRPMPRGRAPPRRRVPSHPRPPYPGSRRG